MAAEAITTGQSNGHGSSVPPPIASGRSSPAGGRASPTVHWQDPPSPLRDRPSRHPATEGGPVTIPDRPWVPERSLSSTSISDDLKSLSTDHHMTDCTEDDCAFGWETYVCDHTCKDPGNGENQSKWSRISIHKLLHLEQENPMLKSYKEGTIRHVHLPANNMTWVQDLILRYYHNKEENKQYRLLRRDFWYGHQHGGKGPIHARFMRPRCDIVPATEKNSLLLKPQGVGRNRSQSPKARFQASVSAPSPATRVLDRSQIQLQAFEEAHLMGDPQSYEVKEPPRIGKPMGTERNGKAPKPMPDIASDGHKDFVISMPFLHWETDDAREKMRCVIVDAMEPGKFTLSGRRISSLGLSKFGQILIPKLVLKARQKIAENPDGMDADEKLLRKYVAHKDRPLHVRRTLDQSYYWTLKDTQHRDRDQVVYRATKKVETATTSVVMVDQLWLWILDGQLVITSFPRRWGRKKSDASGVYRTIRERLDDRPNLDNVYDMAVLMMDQCSRVFFDRTVPKDNRPEMIDHFANAIGEITDKSTKAYLDFWELIKPNSWRYNKILERKHDDLWRELIDRARKKKMLLDGLLDINPEGELLKEIKDIQDELHMIMKVFGEQYTVADDFSTYLQKLGGSSRKVSQKSRDDAKHLVKEISRRRAEIQELTRAAERTADGLKELLDLKQKHANVSEARAGVWAAQETNKILEFTMELAKQSAAQTEQGVKQAEQSSKQNRSLMIFTVVTIIFLPLGFVSSIFGMNAAELGQGSFHIWKEFLIMFPVSILIISFSLAMALNENLLTFCGTVVRLYWAKLMKRFGLLEKWNRRGELITEWIKERKGELEKLNRGGSNV